MFYFTCDRYLTGVYGSLCGYEPFYSDNEAEMFKKIIKCDYVFDSPWWDDVSDIAKVRLKPLSKYSPVMRSYKRRRCEVVVVYAFTHAVM